MKEANEVKCQEVDVTIIFADPAVGRAQREQRPAQ